MVLFKRLGGSEGGTSSTTEVATQTNVSKEDNVTLNLEALPEGLRKHFEGTTLAQAAVDAVASMLASATAHIPEATQTALVDATKRVTDLEGEVTTLKAAANKDDNDVTKGMSDEVRALFKQGEDARVEMQKKLDAEVEKRETRDMVETAKAYKDFPGANPEELGPILYRMSKNQLTAEDLTKVTTLLTAGAQLAKTSALLKQELGTSSGGIGGTDAESRLNDIAKRIQTANPTFTFEKAYDQALQTDEGKAAYTEMRREKIAGGSGVTD